VPLEISFFKADWSRVVRKVIMNGGSATFTVNLPFQPVLYSLNFDSKIGDATSHEVKTIKNNGMLTYSLGKVTLQVQNKGADSSMLRVVHNYVRPDAFKSNPASHRLSNQHYWRIEGLISPGFDATARFNYDGNKTMSGSFAYMDTSLTVINGDSIGLFYRRDATDDWQWLRNAQKTKQGTRTGYIIADTLMMGEYTFGNVGDTSIITRSVKVQKERQVQVYPNPAKTVFTVELTQVQEAELRIMSVDGRLVYSKKLNARETIVEPELPKGSYMVNVLRGGRTLYSEKLIID
jgi:hypothetical protein